MIQLFHFNHSDDATSSDTMPGRVIVGGMMMRLKSILLAIASLLVANLACAREPDHQGNWLAQQEKFNKRIEASNRRATRSICENFCKEQKRPVYAEPEEALEPDTVAEATYERTRTPYQMQFETNDMQVERE
ncbi:hypothetical protein [Microvirga mediterraneensis]|uniref:Uncharacterized protein n=1 Tax=Microvirga mediterraneensis TaxID=2754695 RepID=A0A838BT52_9HYPH|nr:hypothetical protein [Microvirga mediterraneensis]MBA1158558.1 hypothetical protein [Microvirga mediterraneensis]